METIPFLQALRYLLTAATVLYAAVKLRESVFTAARPDGTTEKNQYRIPWYSIVAGAFLILALVWAPIDWLQARAEDGRSAVTNIIEFFKNNE